MSCAPSEDSDQPGHPPSLIRVFAMCTIGAKDPNFLHAGSEDSDQTGRMPRLILIFAGRTCPFVSFVVRWLISWFDNSSYNKTSTRTLMARSPWLIRTPLRVPRKLRNSSKSSRQQLFRDILGIFFFSYFIMEMYVICILMSILNIQLFFVVFFWKIENTFFFFFFFFFFLKDRKHNPKLCLLCTLTWRHGLPTVARTTHV